MGEELGNYVHQNSGGTVSTGYSISLRPLEPIMNLSETLIVNLAETMMDE